MVKAMKLRALGWRLSAIGIVGICAVAIAIPSVMSCVAGAGGQGLGLRGTRHGKRIYTAEYRGEGGGGEEGYTKFKREKRERGTEGNAGCCGKVKG